LPARTLPAVATIIVVGAGVGGLSAAARLAALGHQVTVVEKSTGVGGKAAGYTRDGFTFDLGPSLLTLPAVYRDLFLKTATSRKGAALEDNVDLQAVDPAFAYRWVDGATAVIPGANTNRAAQAFGDALGGSAQQDWQRLCERGARLWAATRTPFLESPAASPWQLVQQLRKTRDVRTVAPWQTLRGLGRQYLSDPRLRLVLERYATYAGSDPRRAPAALASIPFVEQTFGAWHIGGGVAQLASALNQRCLALGVVVQDETEVTKILVDNGRAHGVRLADDRELRADLVVANVDAELVYSELVDDPRARPPLRRLRKATPSMSAFLLLLAVKGRTPDLQHHNVLFSNDYDAEFDAIFGANPSPVPDPTIYVCSPDDPAMRPDDDHEAWCVLVNAPPHAPEHGVDWTAPGVAAAYSDHLVEALAQRGLDVRQRLQWREWRTPADLESQTTSPGGSIYGRSSNSRRSAFLRPANASPIPGLFLVGGSAHPGGGLPLVGMSAAIVSHLIGPA
jgi:phytoene desaturase